MAVSGEQPISLLNDEMEMDMRLIGCASVDQLNPSLVDTRALSMHSASVPSDVLGLQNYDSLVGPQAKL